MKFALIALVVTLVNLLVLAEMSGRNLSKTGYRMQQLLSTYFEGRSTTRMETATPTTTAATTTGTTTTGATTLSAGTSNASNSSSPWHWILVNCQLDARGPNLNKNAEKPLICPQSRCILKPFDRNPSILTKARAVVFNPLWPISAMPVSKPANQLWVYSFLFEAPNIHQGAKPPTARLASKLDLTMTFHPRSDIFRPYQEMLPLTSVPPEDLSADPSKKKYLLIWTVSNCGVGPRNELFKELQSKLGSDRVHLYGGCGKPHPCGRGNTECEIKFYSQYKFYAAFENSRCDGYITEKFYRGFETFMVPLAFGGMGRSDYERVARKDSFLHVDDFGSVDDMANVLKEIDHDDERYSRFHAWRKTMRVSLEMGDRGSEVLDRAYCELCDRIDHPKVSLSSNHDLHRWFFDTCTSNQPQWNQNRSSQPGRR